MNMVHTLQIMMVELIIKFETTGISCSIAAKLKGHINEQIDHNKIGLLHKYW